MEEEPFPSIFNRYMRKYQMKTYKQTNKNPTTPEVKHMSKFIQTASEKVCER